VELSTRSSDKDVVLTVSDDGAGIPEEVRAEIFNPFFTTKPAGQGTGLGLSICHGIVASHGGEMAVESQVGHGTRVQVTLPLRPPGAVR
jgi:signal transduction histidine kinase